MDFRFSRLHEGSAYVSPVERAVGVELPSVPDPVETAVETAAR